MRGNHILGTCPHQRSLISGVEDPVLISDIFFVARQTLSSVFVRSNEEKRSCILPEFSSKIILVRSVKCKKV